MASGQCGISWHPMQSLEEFLTWRERLKPYLGILLILMINFEIRMWIGNWHNDRIDSYPAHAHAE
jgi:hypothetical protein